MVLSGESITAQQAQQAGLVSDVFPSDLTLEYALQLASKMARHSPLALQAAKQALRQSQEVALQAGLAQERQLFTLLAATEDRHEGISAFYKNARPTLKDANDGIHPQSCRKGRDDTNAQPPGTPEQF